MISAMERIAERQQADLELDLLIKLRLRSKKKPSIVEMTTESEGAKRHPNQWDRLEVYEGLVYRRVEGKTGEQDVLQLLVPRRSVQEVGLLWSSQ